MTASLWPARLHHLRRDGADPEALASFYGRLLGDAVNRLDDGTWLVSGRQRRLVVGKGPAKSVPYFALAIEDGGRLERYGAELERLGLRREPFSTPLFRPGSFSVVDPDRRRIVFGVPYEERKQDAGSLPGRLQHFVCASERLAESTAFYRALGLVESDRVLDGDSVAASFLRSDPEHHSFAAFRAPQSGPDHHCYETTGWMDIRDWADRMGSLGIALWWGPGRHGPGNNLFFMVEDPEGYKVEFSAELETLPREAPFRTWPHEQRTLNLWGSAWMRS